MVGHDLFVFLDEEVTTWLQLSQPRREDTLGPGQVREHEARVQKVGWSRWKRHLGDIVTDELGRGHGGGGLLQERLRRIEPHQPFRPEPVGEESGREARSTPHVDGEADRARGRDVDQELARLGEDAIQELEAGGRSFDVPEGVAERWNPIRLIGR